VGMRDESFISHLNWDGRSAEIYWPLINADKRGFETETIYF